MASGDQALFDDVRMHQRTGRPLGDDFMMKVSSIVGRDLAKKKPGPKRNEVIRMRATMLKKQLHSPATTAVDNARMNQDNSIL